MDKDTQAEAVIQAIEIGWHIVENLRGLNRALTVIEKRGLTILNIENGKPEDNEKLLEKIVSASWPSQKKAVNKMLAKRSNLLYTGSTKVEEGDKYPFFKKRG